MDYGTALLMQPGRQLGSVFGVMMNLFLPEIVVGDLRYPPPMHAGLALCERVQYMRLTPPPLPNRQVVVALALLLGVNAVKVRLN